MGCDGRRGEEEEEEGDGMIRINPLGAKEKEITEDHDKKQQESVQLRWAMILLSSSETGEVCAVQTTRRSQR